MRVLVLKAGQPPVERDMTAEELARVPQPAPPAPVRVITALAFLERFTPDERIAIRRAARASEGLEDWLDLLRAAQEIDLDDPRTVSGVNAMVNAGLLGYERRDAILEAKAETSDAQTRIQRP